MTSWTVDRARAGSVGLKARAASRVRGFSAAATPAGRFSPPANQPPLRQSVTPATARLRRIEPMPERVRTVQIVLEQFDRALQLLRRRAAGA